MQMAFEGDAMALEQPKTIILNADDFGYSEETVGVTIDLFNRGILSSATLMPNMPGFAAAARFAQQNPQFSYGLHICLTDEKPACSPGDIPSLVDAQGRLWPTREFWKRAFLGRLNRRDIAREISAQIAAIRQERLEVSHVDSHGHIHKAWAVSKVLRELLPREGIAAIRRTQNLYLHGFEAGKVFNWLTSAAVRRCGRTSDYFLMVTGRIGLNEDGWWQQAVDCLPPGMTEIGMHPGLAEDWRKAETMPLLADNGSLLRERDIRLITYREISRQ